MRALDPNRFSKAFGFDVPASFQKFIGILCEAARGDRDEFYRITDELFFFRPSTELLLAVGFDEARECRYQQTPLELIPFGNHGVDGAHIGFVVATPELLSAELPIGVFNPLDLDGVVLSGMTFQSALERRVGELLHEEGDTLDGAARQLVRTLQVEFKLSGKAVTNDLGWSTQNPICMSAPEGYTQLETSDGIGVLAPNHQVSEKQQIGEVGLDEVLRAAQGFGMDELWGNALHVLREAAWVNNGDDFPRRAIAHAMIGVYERLGRPVLARLANRRAGGEF